MAIAVIGKLVVRSRELLETLSGDAGEITGELSVLGEDHRTACHEAVDQRLLPHLSNPNPKLSTAKIFSASKKKKKDVKERK